MASQAWGRFEAVARARGEATALVHGEERLSFAGLRAAALGWAARLDVSPGERVVVAAENGLAAAAALPGLWARGAIPVLVGADAPPSHLRHACALTNAALVLSDRPRGDLAPPVMAIDGLPPPGPERAPVPQPGSAPASVVFTSGSSGPPKGVTQAAATLLWGADRVAGVLCYREGDSILCPVPFAFDYGWGQLLSCLFRGFCVVLPTPRGAFGLCEALARHRPTVLAGVPAVWGDLLAGLAPTRATDRSCVRLLTNTGARIPRPAWEALLDLFPDADVALNYGLTETYRSACLPPAEARSHPDSVGWALPGAALAVVRPDGTACAPEEEGEVVHRGAGAFMGYWGDAKATARALRPDPLWPHAADLAAPLAVFTGDLGRKDGDGRLYVHGRRDRQMKSMGVRVSPDEVEAALLAHGAAREVAVVSRPHDVVGDLLVAAVALDGAGADAEAGLRLLKRHVRGVLSPYMAPREWLVLDRLPRTANGKVDYPALTRQARGGDA